MGTNNYFLVITESVASKEKMAAIFNISGMAQSYFGYGNTSWWILPKSKKEIDEAKKMLQDVTEIQKFQLAKLNNPVNEVDVENVRELLNEFQFDTSRINDSEFILYLNSLIEKKFDFYIDIPETHLPPYPAKVVVKLLKDHPYFSADQLNKKPLPMEEDVDREYTIDDFEIIHESFEVTIDPFDEANEDNLPSGDKLKSNDNEKPE